MLRTSGFVDDVMFFHNRPNTEKGLVCDVANYSPETTGGAAELCTRERSLLSSIALHEFELFETKVSRLRYN